MILIRKNYRLILDKDKRTGLTKTEDLAIEMFINDIGNGTSVELNKIKKYCSSELNARNIISLYNEFIKSGVNEGKKKSILC